MKVRYCQTLLQQLKPCGAGWASGGTSPQFNKDCSDDPMEENCCNIVDTKNLRCPYCGSKIKMEVKDETNKP